MRTLLVTVVAAALGSAALAAQARPDFSGTWTLVSTVPSGRDVYGAEFSVTQDAATLTITTKATRRTITSRGGVTEPGVDTPYTTRTIYTLDGGEHPHQTSNDLPPNPPGTVSVTLMRLQESMSKAVWTGRQLALVTHEKHLRGRAPNESVSRTTTRTVLSLDSDGLLAVERLQLIDPVTSQVEQGLPVPVRSVYKKKSSSVRFERGQRIYPRGAPGR
jgi:hypothetical protein